ncbi:MAG: DUF4242 domain-containing protein [Gemmatimonadota bacterium]|nr:DUF4242 domain-containing protein [Gemmatimonadota bacterium]
MPRYLIRREIPGAGKLSRDELQQIAMKSNGVIHGLNLEGRDVQWVHSYVVDDGIYCVYNAPSADVVREHAMKGEFPANAVMDIREIIDPTTAETKRA